MGTPLLDAFDLDLIAVRMKVLAVESAFCIVA